MRKVIIPQLVEGYLNLSNARQEVCNRVAAPFVGTFTAAFPYTPDTDGVLSTPAEGLQHYWNIALLSEPTLGALDMALLNRARIFLLNF
ncbi:MAG: hypothetical protein QGH82_05665 [Candidatus Woesearchaeota archaeon]|nr:hypothetical protein [Candidatus Woesearchaeota archaeon]